MIKKLALGTAQFGLNYGISNTRGQIPQEEVCEILQYAHQMDISTLDTAQAYGNSEETLGNCFKKNKFETSPFKIVTKLSDNNIHQLKNSLYNSFEKLNTNYIYGVLFHDVNSFKRNLNTYNDLIEFKRKNIIEKIGFSLYLPSDLIYLIENKTRFDIVQIPYNIFDRRFEEYFPTLRKLNVEIHVRSVFLQGLVFRKISELTKHFHKFEQKLLLLNNITKELNLSKASICLNFVIHNTYIDKIVIGVESIDNLKENVSLINTEFNPSRVEFDLLIEKDEEILLPYNWQ